jgi:hypothetical protein
MKAVLDTVVFVRALINPASVWGQLLEAHDEYDSCPARDPVEIVDVLTGPSCATASARCQMPGACSASSKAAFVEPGASSPYAAIRTTSSRPLPRRGHIVSEDRDILVTRASRRAHRTPPSSLRCSPLMAPDRPNRRPTPVRACPGDGGWSQRGGCRKLRCRPQMGVVAERRVAGAGPAISNAGRRRAGGAEASIHIAVWQRCADEPVPPPARGARAIIVP